MVTFNADILKFDRNKEKTGWTYIIVAARHASKMKPGCHVSFRVKGTLDQYAFQKTALLPAGDGSFILPVNGTMRKALRKKHGDKLKVTMEADDSKLPLSADLLKCLKDDPDAQAFFKTLSPSHQRYFSNWIESAKTPATKARRIVMAITGLGRKQDYGAMIRSNKSNPE